MLIESGPEHIKRTTGKTTEEVANTKKKESAAAKKKREAEAKKQPGYQAPSGGLDKAAE